MKKFSIINLTCLLAATMFLVFLPTNSYASGYSNEQMQDIENSEIRLLAEETGYKYKVINGKLYKRLWSYTYARWIDKDWILIS
ncbi:hypothetical protein RZO55_16990 [Clostridium boliviensis]|uniref:Uncharacterized protein n=1 Tax=Clostridium boliviensis TaxID=318465 RepID=A0ABU4GNS0_9CLOT|nr:hypothetical protein [Clostridium boliviensis]MDW2799271.1 hypothetical protein [Clostridium boliviensis]